MQRWLLVLPLLVACGGEIGVGSIDTDDPGEVEDLSMYDGASLRIVEPASSSFLPWGDTHGFQAEVRAADGTLLDDVQDVVWVSSVDETWTPTGATFSDDTIDVGLHELTAEVVLPNGDRLAHTVGGVLVQAEEAGTYVGTFQASTQLQQIPVACAGAAVLIVDPYGETVSGDADCVAQAGQFEIPLEFVIDADNLDGRVEGNATATIVAFDVDFPAEGELDTGAETLELSFGGPVFTSELNGRVRTERISRDAGL